MIDLTDKNIVSSNEKISPDQTTYGNREGKIHFGYLFPSNIKGDSSSALASVHLQGFHSLHYLSMIKDGPMQGTTINRSPGPYQIVCASEPTNTTEIGYFLLAENGDIIIRAPNGRVRISGIDVDIRAEGNDNTRGAINIDSNQSVNIKTGSFDVKADLGARIFTPNTIDMIANSSMTIISNFINGLSSASSVRPNKVGPASESTEKFKTYSSY